MAPRIEIILGSIREGRAGERVARWVHGLASRRADLEVELLDLKDWPLPTYANAANPKQAETGYEDPLARAWHDRIARADGFVIVTPEYNFGYPPALKNALDYLYAPWNNKPVAFASYGGTSGGVRAVQQLRQVVIELQMAPIRAEVNIPFVSRAFGEQGEPLDPLHAKRAEAMFDQLAWWAVVLREGRERHPLAAPARARA